MLLDTDELVELTGKKRCDAQVRALRGMGIEHRIRPNGTVAVSRLHVEQTLGAMIATEKKPKEFKLEWN